MGSAKSDPRRAGTIYTLSLCDHAPAPVAPLVEASFYRLGPEAEAELAEAMGPGSTAAIRRRFASGSQDGGASPASSAGRRCYAARVAGRLATYGWVSFGGEYIGELNLWIRLQPGEAYIWDCATLPAYRQQRLYSALLSDMIAELRREPPGRPLERLWIGANLDNLPSQKGILRAGFQAVADMAVERVLAMRQVWVLGHPGVPDDLVAEARRVFLDNRDRVWLAAMKG